MSPGADGVVIGTRFWGAAESLVDRRLVRPTMAHTGDDTTRTRVIDIIRGIDWPDRYTGRVLRTPFIERWKDDAARLRSYFPAQEKLWTAAFNDADIAIAEPFVGEAIGLVSVEETAAQILDAIQSDLELELGRLAAGADATFRGPE